MNKRMILIVPMFLAAGLISGCVAAPLLPVIDIIPVVGVSYQGYTFWKGRESMRYYANDVDTTYQAVKRSIEQLKLETTTQNPVSESGYSLETEGNQTMNINFIPV